MGCQLSLRNAVICGSKIRARSRWLGVRIAATVNDTWQLRWWLMGQGAGVEVCAPVELRDEIRTALNDVGNLYLYTFGNRLHLTNKSIGVGMRLIYKHSRMQFIAEHPIYIFSIIVPSVICLVFRLIVDTC